MAVKIVTDSSSDLPDKIIKELGITVVPLYIRFGDKVYRDRIDINADEFYRKLQHEPTHPSTTQPTPQDFADVYKNLAAEADGIVSIHLSAKLSGTCNSALQAKEMVGECPIEVIDSQIITMGLGFISMAAARVANAGGSMREVVDEANRVMPDIHLLGLLDTLKYLALGGRIGRAKALLGSVLNVKPILTIKDGEVAPAGQVRSRSKGVERLFEFVQNASDIQDLAVVYNTTLDEAQTLAERINPIFPKEKIVIASLGPMIGVHVGPGILFATIRGKKGT